MPFEPMSNILSAALVEHGASQASLPTNEPVRGYVPGSPERASLTSAIKRMAADEIEMPLLIGGQEVRTRHFVCASIPHDHSRVLGRRALTRASDSLRDAAGNFYFNNKPTRAVAGQQPSEGGRRSRTNDKAGSPWNLLRWVSPRTIKETSAPPSEYR